jgi:type III secretory pathway component EscS
MRQTRKTMALALSLSITSIVVAPVSIGLSISLLQHPSFFTILERENEFDSFLLFF